MRPIDLGVLMHYCTSADHHPKLNVAVYEDAAKWLVKEGALYVIVGGYEVTDLGRAWLQLACRTQKPRMAFVDGDGRELTS